LAWTVNFEPRALGELKKLDRNAQIQTEGSPPADRQERLLAKLAEVEKAVLSG
jgi:hypothetical protein